MDEVLEARKLCGHPTADGTPCRRLKEIGEERCYQHADTFSHKIRSLSRNHPLGFWLTIFFGVVTVIGSGFAIVDHYSKTPISTALFQRPNVPTFLTTIAPPGPTIAKKNPAQTPASASPEYGNLRARTLYLAATILDLGKMRVSGYPDRLGDRNKDAANDTNWMHYNYVMFMRKFDEPLHSIQREYATHEFALPEFDRQLKSIDEGRQSPEWTHMMWDHDFCIWVEDLNQLANMIPHDRSARGPVECDLRHK